MFAIDCFGVDIREAQIEPNKCVNTQLAECLNKGCVFQCSSVGIIILQKKCWSGIVGMSLSVIFTTYMYMYEAVQRVATVVYESAIFV